MKKLTLLLFAIILLGCSDDDETTPENNSNTTNFKIEYTTILSDANLDLDITYMWNDENGQVQSEILNIVNPQAYSTLEGEKTVVITNMIGVTFKVNGGGNFLSDTFVKVTNVDDNISFEVTNTESIASTGGSIDNNTLIVNFNSDTNTFQSDYTTTN